MESGGEVFKVQVKSTRFRKPGTAYGCDFRHRRGNEYRPSEVDVAAVYLVPEDLWYIVPLSAIPGHNLTLDPSNRHNKWRRYREAWDLLMPERRRRWWRKPKHARSLALQARRNISLT